MAARKSIAKTFETVHRSIIGAGVARNLTEAQRRAIAALVVKTDARWDVTTRHSFTVWGAASMIDTLKEYEAAGGYAAFEAAREKAENLRAWTEEAEEAGIEITPEWLAQREAKWRAAVARWANA